MKQKTVLTILGALCFLTLAGIATTETPTYIADSAVFLVLLILLHITYSHWKLNPIIYTAVILSLILHVSGVFGWYNKSPVPISWDHVTHFAAIFSFTLLFFQYARQYMDHKFSRKNFTFMFLVLLGGLGVGSIIETAEFTGFMIFGFGEGGFLFGAGDSYGGVQNITETDLNVVGGGYFNTMYDLLWNALGAVAAIILMVAVHHRKKKKY